MHKTREAIDIQQEALLDIDSTPFEIFANFHPVEAFNKDSVIFCEYFRKKTGKNLTDKEIETFVDSNRELFEPFCLKAESNSE